MEVNKFTSCRGQPVVDSAHFCANEMLHGLIIETATLKRTRSRMNPKRHRKMPQRIDTLSIILFIELKSHLVVSHDKFVLIVKAEMKIQFNAKLEWMQRR